MDEDKTEVKKCLNCGHELEDMMYCPICGQKNINRPLTLKTIIYDFMGDYFTFDSKLFRSLVPLLFKPGYLSKEYIIGRRARYIPPMRLYLFVSFIFFAYLAIVVGSKLDEGFKEELDKGNKEKLENILKMEKFRIPNNSIDKEGSIMLSTLFLPFTFTRLFFYYL